MLISSLFEFYYRKYIYIFSCFGLYFDFHLRPYLFYKRHTHSTLGLIRLQTDKSLIYYNINQFPKYLLPQPPDISHIWASTVLISDYQAIYGALNKESIKRRKQISFCPNGISII